MNKKDYLTNKFFCPIPWTGFHYNFDGTVKNCVRSPGIIGNLQDNSIEEIIHGDVNKKTKTLMLESSPGDDCHVCYNLEKNNNSLDIISDRIFYLKELKNVENATYDSADNFSLRKIDIRWSNLCNFACVYCGPEYSSKWEEEIKWPIKTPMQSRIADLKNYVFERVTDLEHVYLAGGEPLLIKENLELLELLREKNPDVNLRINTNLSKVDTKNFDLICQFKNVHWIISVETIEEEYEYIRFGGKWLDFIDNLKIIQNLGHKVSFNMLYFALNSMSIFRCIDFLTAMGFHNNSFIIGELLNPENLNVRHLPESMLNLARIELSNRINERPGFLLEDGLKNVLKYVNTPIEKNTDEVFKFLETLDSRRGIDSRKIFKDLYGY